MTLSSVLNAHEASERFPLLYLTGRRLATLDLVSVGGGVYQATYSGLVIKSVARTGGVALNYTTSVVSNDDWSYNEDTGVFRVKLASAPANSSNNVIVTFQLFYTEHKMRVWSVLGPDGVTPIDREFQPRIQASLRLVQSAANMLQGILSTQTCTIDIIDADRAFRPYLDSFVGFTTFHNCPVEIRFGYSLSGTVASETIFSGTVAHIDFHGSTAQITIVDNSGQLRVPAYMGDSVGECVMTGDSASFPNMDPTKYGAPLRYLAANKSRFTTDTFALPSSTSVGQLITNGTEAVCTDYTANGDNTKNRVWTLCRLDGGLVSPTVSGISRVTASGNRLYWKLTGQSGFEVGDTLFWSESALPYVGTVIAVGTALNFGVNSDYTLMTSSDTTPSASTSSTIHLGLSVGVIIKANGAIYRPSHAVDYTLALTSTSGGHGLVTLTFANTLESNLSMATLDPSTMSVEFRISSAADCKHTTIVKKLVQSANIAANGASFTDTVYSPVPTVSCWIPYFDETTYRTYADYIQDIARATVSVLWVDPASGVSYKVLQQTGTSTALDSTQYLRDSLNIQLEYQDVYQTLVVDNPHVANYDARINGVTNTVSYTSMNGETRDLDQIMTTLVLRHPLADISQSISPLLGINSNRRVLYTFETATANITSNIGDTLTLQSIDALGITQTVNLTILEITKGPDKTQVVGCDLLGL